MARRSSPRPSAYRSPIATPRVPRLVVQLRPVPVSRGWGDARQYHPLGPFRPLHAVPRSAARVVARDPRPRSSMLSHDRLGFALPERVMRCVQRKERREVLFAKRKTGKGARSPKRRNYWSAISCK